MADYSGVDGSKASLGKAEVEGSDKEVRSRAQPGASGLAVVTTGLN